MASRGTSTAFSTGVVLASIGFILGTLFMAQIPEHKILFTGPPTSDDYLRLEQYYLTLWTSPLAVKALFHVMLVAPAAAFVFTLATKTEAAIYFDGLSVLFQIGVISMYTSTTVPNLRLLASSPSTPSLASLVSSLSGSSPTTAFDPSSPSSFFHRFVRLISAPTAIMSKSRAAEAAEAFAKELETNPVTDARRKELLSITAAAHTLVAVLLLGILGLQAGKVYAVWQEQKALEAYEKEEAAKRRAAAGGAPVLAGSTGPVTPVTVEKKTQ